MSASVRKLVSTSAEFVPGGDDSGVEEDLSGYYWPRVAHLTANAGALSRLCRIRSCWKIKVLMPSVQWMGQARRACPWRFPPPTAQRQIGAHVQALPSLFVRLALVRSQPGWPVGTPLIRLQIVFISEKSGEREVGCSE